MLTESFSALDPFRTHGSLSWLLAPTGQANLSAEIPSSGLSSPIPESGIPMTL
jgi:hypothetical protein